MAKLISIDNLDKKFRGYKNSKEMRAVYFEITKILAENLFGPEQIEVLNEALRSHLKCNTAK